SVFAHDATAPRIVFDTPRPGIGSFTEVETTLTMRPQRAWRIPGSTACGRVWLATRCLLKASRQASTEASCAPPPAGPPVSLTRTCTCALAARALTLSPRATARETSGPL